jgi:hypothetical protein
MSAPASVSFTNGILILSCAPLGAHQVNAYADGDDVISVARREDSASDEVGCDGEMVVSVSTNRSGTLKIKTLQTSDTNAYLSRASALFEAGQLPGGISGLFQDANRQDVGSMIFGYPKKPADFVRGRKANSPEWEIVFKRTDVQWGNPAFAVIGV